MVRRRSLSWLPSSIGRRHRRNGRRLFSVLLCGPESKLGVIAFSETGAVQQLQVGDSNDKWRDRRQMHQSEILYFSTASPLDQPPYKNYLPGTRTKGVLGRQCRARYQRTQTPGSVQLGERSLLRQAKGV